MRHTIDEYINAQPEAYREPLRRVRETIRVAGPKLQNALSGKCPPSSKRRT
jgi:uncharacterized protein YdhG (YjbR/CyaY superfamily)